MPALTLEHIRSFASPVDHRDEAVRLTAFASFGKVSCSRVLRQVEPFVPANLFGIMSAYAVCLPQTSELWRSEFSIALERSVGQPLGSAVQLALGMHALGMQGAWAVQVPEPTWFLFDGHLLEVTKRIEVLAAQGDCEIQFDPDNGAAHTRLHFRQVGHRWRMSGDPCNPLEERSPDITLLPRHNSLAKRGIWPENQNDLMAADNLAAVRKELLGAFEIIASYTPEFNGWVRSTIRHVIPVAGNGEAGIFQNGSTRARPGLVLMSFPQSELRTGEVLVHESSHQLFNVASALTSLCDSSDAAVAYSPIKETTRPINACLLAYHAVVNMILYYRYLRRGGYEVRGWYVKRLEGWIEMAEEYEKIFHDNEEFLTASGRVFLDALKDQSERVEREVA
jgi:HEXXH motif-containing protein